MTVKRYSLSGDRMFPAKSGQWVAAEDHDALRSRLAEALDVIRDVTLHGGITNWRDLENRMVACLRPADSASVQHEPDPPYGSEAYLFRELMAIMHGDGGHYHAQHGAQKAYEDACTKYWRLVVTAENTADPTDTPHET